MPITTNRYGLHMEGEFAFLHEDARERCLTPGFEGLRSPFIVQRPGFACPHAFLSGVEEFNLDVSVPDHPLVAAMAPVPSTRVYWIDAPARQTIEDLVPLFSPSGLSIYAPWAIDIRGLALRLTLTNLGPIIVTGYDYKHLPRFQQLLHQPRTRPVIFCGAVCPPGVDEVLPIADIATLRPSRPWRAIGWALLQQWVEAQ